MPATAKKLPDFSTLNAKGANDPLKRLSTIHNTMKTHKQNPMLSPTAKKIINFGDQRTHRNKSVNVMNRTDN
jgi:hypothetical protein